MPFFQPRPRFGIGLRRPYFDRIDQHHNVDFFEVVTENVMTIGGAARHAMLQARERGPVIPHGVGLSIGGPDPLREDYLKSLRALLELLAPPYFSDHLCYASAFGVEYHDLIPLPFSWEAVRHVVERVKDVQDRMGLPLALENPSYYFEPPGAEMSEAAFLGEICERADCKILLDINNVYVNARNHNYDPYHYIDALPLDRVVQFHMAGHDDTGPFIVDTHGAPTIESVRALYRYTLPKTSGPAWTLLEWDHNLPPFDAFMAEFERIRACGLNALTEHASASPERVAS